MKPINRVGIHEFCDRSVGIGSSVYEWNTSFDFSKRGWESYPISFHGWIAVIFVQLSRRDNFTQTLLCTGIISDYRNLLVYDSVRRLRYKREAREIGFVKDAGVTRSLLSPVSGTKKRVDDVVAPRTIHDIPEHVLTCGLTLPGKSDKFYTFV